MKLPNEVYDVLKWVVMLLLPAIATLIVVVGKIWGFDLAPKISETIIAVDTALGAVIGISTINYNKE